MSLYQKEGGEDNSEAQESSERFGEKERKAHSQKVDNPFLGGERERKDHGQITTQNGRSREGKEHPLCGDLFQDKGVRDFGLFDVVQQDLKTEKVLIEGQEAYKKRGSNDDGGDPLFITFR